MCCVYVWCLLCVCFMCMCLCWLLDSMVYRNMLCIFYSRRERYDNTSNTGRLNKSIQRFSKTPVSLLSCLAEAISWFQGFSNSVGCPAINSVYVMCCYRYHDISSLILCCLVTHHDVIVCYDTPPLNIIRVTYYTMLYYIHIIYIYIYIYIAQTWPYTFVWHQTTPQHNTLDRPSALRRSACNTIPR